MKINDKTMKMNIELFFSNTLHTTIIFELKVIRKEICFI